MFAGPNGSGKSTVTANFQALPNFPTNYANADEIAKTLSGDAMAQSYQAARMVEQQRLDMDDRFLLQAVGETVVLQDRLLLKPDYSIGQMPLISYREGVG
jgi:predicted ABC-type ATPase